MTTGQSTLIFSTKRNKIQKGHFSYETAFQRRKCTTNLQFRQTFCGIVSESASNILMGKKFSGLIDSSGKCRQFSVPVLRENLDFTPNDAQ
jgi:hypothetical protein